MFGYGGLNPDTRPFSGATESQWNNNDIDSIRANNWSTAGLLTDSYFDYYPTQQDNSQKIAELQAKLTEYKNYKPSSNPFQKRDYTKEIADVEHQLYLLKAQKSANPYQSRIDAAQAEIDKLSQSTYQYINWFGNQSKDNSIAAQQKIIDQYNKDYYNPSLDTYTPSVFPTGFTEGIATPVQNMSGDTFFGTGFAPTYLGAKNDVTTIEEIVAAMGYPLAATQQYNETADYFKWKEANPKGTYQEFTDPVRTGATDVSFEDFKKANPDIPTTGGAWGMSPAMEAWFKTFKTPEGTQYTPKADTWENVVKDPTHPMFGTAVLYNVEGLTPENVAKYLETTIANEYKYATNPEYYQGATTALQDNGTPWDPITVKEAGGIGKIGADNPYNAATAALAPAMDWLMQGGYATKEQLNPYYEAYKNIAQFELDNANRWDDFWDNKNYDESPLGEWWDKEALPVMPLVMGSLMGAVGGIGGALAGGPILGGAMGGAIGGMINSDPNSGVLGTLEGGAKGGAIGAATGAVTQEMGANGLDISGTVGDAAFNAGASDWVAQQAGQLTENIARGTASGLIKNPSDPLGVLTNSAIGSFTGAGFDAANGFVVDTVKDLFGTSPDFTSYSNDLANQYFDGGIVNNTIDSFTPDSYFSSANPDLSQVTGQFLNNTASESPFTDNYKGSLLNYDPNADPFKENFANATEGMSILGDGNKLVVDETLDDPIKYKDKKTSATKKKTAASAPSTRTAMPSISTSKLTAQPYEAYKWFTPGKLADYAALVEQAEGGKSTTLRDLLEMEENQNKLGLDQNWFS